MQVTSQVAYADTILKILDRQKCRLDSKYARVFTKKRNVPIVMIANGLPNVVTKMGPSKPDSVLGEVQ